MSAQIIPLPSRAYQAEFFKAPTKFGAFAASGTLCGHIDFSVPGGKTYPLNPDEAALIIQMLSGAREDVLANSDPDDPRIRD